MPQRNKPDFAPRKKKKGDCSPFLFFQDKTDLLASELEAEIATGSQAVGAHAFKSQRTN